MLEVAWNEETKRISISGSEIKLELAGDGKPRPIEASGYLSYGDSIPGRPRISASRPREWQGVKTFVPYEVIFFVPEGATEAVNQGQGRAHSHSGAEPAAESASLVSCT